MGGHENTRCLLLRLSILQHNQERIQHRATHESGVTLDDNTTAWETAGRSFGNKPDGGNGKITRKTKRKWRKNGSEEKPETSGGTTEKSEKAEPGAAGESTGTAVNASRRKKRWHEEMEMEDDDGDEQDGQEDSKGEQDQEVEDESDTDEEEFDIDKSKSAIYKHLVSSPDCRKLYDDSWFSVIVCARFFKQLQVLEAVYICTRDPVVCKQKENVVALTLFK